MISNKLFKNRYDDNGLSCKVDIIKTKKQLVDQVINMFETHSELIYPAKFIFCNIVYSYYLSKYFGGVITDYLDDYNVLEDSPMYFMYNDYKDVYDDIIRVVHDKIEQYQSVEATKRYFDVEFLIGDVDGCELPVLCEDDKQLQS